MKKLVLAALLAGLALSGSGCLLIPVHDEGREARGYHEGHRHHGDRDGDRDHDDRRDDR